MLIGEGFLVMIGCFVGSELIGDSYIRSGTYLFTDGSALCRTAALPPDKWMGCNSSRLLGIF